MPPSIPPKLKLLATSFAISLFRLLRTAKRGAQNLFSGVGRFMAPVGRLLVKLFILPIYRLGVTSRLRVNRLALPARGFALFFITNRFLLHVTIAVLALLTIAANLQGRQAHAQDVGQNSVLFALATEQRTEIVEENVSPETPAKNANYLGSATVSGIPHVDFDYDESADPVTPSIVVPGTIAAVPYETQTGTTRAPRTKIETYVVQENDTISSIADHFGVNIGTILWNNNLTERQYIRPGDKLTIPPVSGLIATVKSGDTLSKLAAKYSADATEIASVNGLTPDSQLALGSSVVIPGGKPPEIVQIQNQIAYHAEPTPVAVAQPKPTATVTTPDEVLTEPSTPEETPPSDGGVTPAKPADVDTTGLSSSKLLWPTSGHVITQYYGWRHTGVDIDGDYTSPIYAAADGVIEKAGWNSGGYGLMILIDHPNGLKTRYGHTSKMFVKAGDTVKKGQVIAMMGTTGRSTGTHLHFEVYVGANRTNPLAYIK